MLQDGATVPRQMTAQDWAALLHHPCGEGARPLLPPLRGRSAAAAASSCKGEAAAAASLARTEPAAASPSKDRVTSHVCPHGD